MLNRVVLAGRLVRDPEIKKTTNGVSFMNFTVAIDRPRAKNNSNQTADFVSCVAWRHSADFLGTYASKGSMIGVDGALQTRSYKRIDGTTAYITEVNCENVSILESKKTEQSNQSYQPTYFDDPANFTDIANSDNEPF